jgi:membrane protein YqaA with SNARE-associated domain
MAETATANVRPGPLRRLYNWVLRNAEGRHAWAMLAMVAFAEASFFPIPPDVVMVPMALARRNRAVLIGAWATLWSVMGGMLGYAIGSVLYDSVGHWLISVYGMGGELDAFRIAYAKHAWLILFQGVTPFPYKLITIASGFAGFSFPLFMLFSTITRGIRFVGEGVLLYYFGETVRDILEKWLEYILLAMLALIVVGYVAVRYLF